MKQPNWKTPVILLGLLGGLGLFTYWLQFSHKPKKEEQESAIKKPLALPSKDSQIASFTFRGTQTNLSARCDSIAEGKCKVSEIGSWTITAPLETKADPAQIQNLLRSLTDGISTDTVNLSEDTPEKRTTLFADYGLSEKDRGEFTTPTIELTLSDGKKLSAWFGLEHPMGDKFYVASAVDGKVNDQTVFILSSFLRSNLEKNLTYFRDKTLFTQSRDDITEFSFKNSKGAFEGKSEQKNWSVNGAPANYSKVEAFLGGLLQLRVKEFLGKEDPTRGLKDVFSATLTHNKSGTPPTPEKITIQIFEKNAKVGMRKPSAFDHSEFDGHDHGGPAPSAGQEEKVLYLKTSVRPDVVEIESSSRTKLEKGMVDFRDTELISSTQKATIDKVRFESPKQKEAIEFEKKGEQWASSSPAAADFDPKKVEELLQAMTRGPIQDYVSPNPIGNTARDRDSLMVFLIDSKAATQAQFLFATAKSKLFARDVKQIRNEATRVDDGLKSALPFDWNSWKVKK